MNKSQKIILTIWIILETIAFIITINPLTDQFGYSVGYSPNWKEFIGLSVIFSIPSFVLCKVWGNKKTA